MARQPQEVNIRNQEETAFSLEQMMAMQSSADNSMVGPEQDFHHPVGDILNSQIKNQFDEIVKIAIDNNKRFEEMQQYTSQDSVIINEEENSQQFHTHINSSSHMNNSSSIMSERAVTVNVANTSELPT